jgi:hypothetical protein
MKVVHYQLFLSLLSILPELVMHFMVPLQLRSPALWAGWIYYNMPVPPERYAVQK